MDVCVNAHMCFAPLEYVLCFDLVDECETFKACELCYDSLWEAVFACVCVFDVLKSLCVRAQVGSVIKVISA